MPELINIGVSALLANQANLSTTGQNISNANTPGYSRQQAIAVTTPAQPTGFGYLGSGVAVEGVRRIVDIFAAAEMRSTGDNVNRIEQILVNSEQLDNMLGQESTGLSPILQRFFTSLQTASEDPASVAGRQVVLTSTELMTNRMNQLSSRLDVQNEAINSQIGTLTSEITTLASSLASLNDKISLHGGGSIGRLPNDLLDERDRVLQRMSELVDVQVVENENRTTNVYVGVGQALVVSNRSFDLTSAAGKDDPSRQDVIFKNGNRTETMTDSIYGGQLGGLLEFRRDILDESYGQLGIVALGLSEKVNEQHQLGMTLDGKVGGDFFRDINDDAWAMSRSIAKSTNLDPSSSRIRTEIESVAEMTTADYQLRFSPASTDEYTVTRISDNSVVAKKAFSGTFPSVVEFDGVKVTIEAGNFAAGDSFLIAPSRNAAHEMRTNVSNVRDLAFAQPVRVESAEANRGTGVVDQGQVLDTTRPLFSKIESDKTLNPPMIVKFTSARTYDVLDNTNPAKPVPLVPSLMNQRFVPGTANALLPLDLNQSAVTSDGADLGIATRNAVAGAFNNGYAAENLVVTSVDPMTKAISRQTLATTAQDSAALIASQLNEFTNTSAVARNYAVLNEIESTTPMTLTLNGENFTVTAPNQLASAINQNAALRGKGITALSDGSRVELFSTTGDNFQITVAGGATDQLSVAGTNGAPITLIGTDPIPQVTIGGQLDVTLDDGVSMTGASSVFSTLPKHEAAFLGLQVTLGGSPAIGDIFEINYNKDGFSDNRNSVALGAVQTTKFMSNGEATIRDTYANLINFVGTRTNEASLDYEAAQALFDRAVSERDATSGVNLDEEAANVIKFEQAYNASAQLIAVARSIFDTLLNSVG